MEFYNNQEYMKRIMNTLLPALFMLAIISCGNDSTQQAAPPEYKVLTLDTTTAVIYNEYSTIISSDAQIFVRPKVTGYIAKKYINEGDLVEAGDMLYKIDDTEFRQQENSAKAGLQSAIAKEANAELEVKKLTPLVEKGIISAYELESAKSNLEAAKAAHMQAKAAYDNALTTLGYTEIRATKKGILGTTYASVGELVSPSNANPLTVISTDGTMSAYFSFDEKNLTPEARKKFAQSARSQNGEHPAFVELVLSDGSVYPYKGRVYHASGIIDVMTGSLLMKVDFENPDFAVLSGTSGTLRFPIEFKGCIEVPQTATYELQDKKMVFVVNDDNTVTRKIISVEGTTNKAYVVNNLERGTRIVAEGVDRLKDGMVITPKQ